MPGWKIAEWYEWFSSVPSWLTLPWRVVMERWGLRGCCMMLETEQQAPLLADSRRGKETGNQNRVRTETRIKYETGLKDVIMTIKLLWPKKLKRKMIICWFFCPERQKKPFDFESDSQFHLYSWDAQKESKYFDVERENFDLLLLFSACDFSCAAARSLPAATELGSFGWQIGRRATRSIKGHRPLGSCFGVFLTVILWFDFDVPICGWWIIVWFPDNLWESSVFWWHSMQMGDIWVLQITTAAPLHLPSRSVSKLTN